MPIWKKDTPPQDLSRAEKRNVIATDIGWVRRQSYRMGNGTVRTKDELLVSYQGLANSSIHGTVSISDLWHSVSGVETATYTCPKTLLTGGVKTSGSSTTLTGTGTKFSTELVQGSTIKLGNAYRIVSTIASNTSLTLNTAITLSNTTYYKLTFPTVDTYVAFNEPISSKSDAKIVVANTASGNNMIAFANTTVEVANNSLRFRWQPKVLGTYKVQAQSLANATGTALNIRSLNSGNEVATKVITGGASGVANTAGTFVIVGS